MRIQSKIDWWVKIALWGAIIIMIIVMIMIPQQEKIIGFAVGIPMIFLLLWIYFGSYYEFRGTYLLCKVGPYYEKIEYDKIKSIKQSKNMLSSMALSTERIEIKQHGKGYIMGTTFISPVNREEFVIELKSRCRNIEKSY